MAVPPKPPSKLMSVTELDYFHDDLAGMDMVRERLRRYQKYDGYFLLRKSMRVPDSYSVSVIHASSIKHFNILSSGIGYYLTQDIFFPTVGRLIDHYSNHDVPNQEGIQGVQLRVGIKRPGPFRNSAAAAAANANVAMPIRRSDPQLTRPYEREASASNLNPVAPDAKRLSDLSTRPQPPTPMDEREISGGSQSEYTYYSCAQTRDRLDQLMELVKDESMTCDCGLDFEESQLPGDWSVHVSRDPTTYGRPFFMGPSNETAWELPTAISVRMDDTQRRFMLTLLDNFARGVPPPPEGGAAAASGAKRQGGGGGFVSRGVGASAEDSDGLDSVGNTPNRNSADGPLSESDMS